MRENRKGIKARRKARQQRDNSANGQSPLRISIPEQINSRKGMSPRDLNESVDSSSSSEQLKSDSDYFSCDSSEQDYDMLE